MSAEKYDCPHCVRRVAAVPGWTTVLAAGDLAPADQAFQVKRLVCTSCNLSTLEIHNSVGGKTIAIRAWPRVSTRPELPPEVPKDLRVDYNEAAIVLPFSAKASAALSRRCLQHLIRVYFKIGKRDLAGEIQELIDSNKLPSDLAESVGAIRSIGNFAAHPMKSSSTGEIVDVEPNEAEWNLDVLDELFEFQFVRPERLKKKREALNIKLDRAGKPPVKQP